MCKESTIYSKNNASKQIKDSNLFVDHKDNNSICKKNDLLSLNHTQINIHQKITIKKIQMMLFSMILNLICLNVPVQCDQNTYSYITLKTNVSGYVQVISDSYIFLQNETSINDNKCLENQKRYYLNNSESIIKLTWYYELEDTSNMFKGCSKITEINLSNFDSSMVQEMNHMFYGCSSLISLDLTNLETSMVVDMNSMFSGCSSLISLDLSYLDTSMVVIMNNMFYGCSSLISLDLSNFNAENSDFFNYMFFGCSNLGYLNIKRS